MEFLSLKQRFFPGIVAKNHKHLEGILIEIKGSDIRKNISLGSRIERRHAIGFLDKIVDLLIKYDMVLFGRVGVKGIGINIDGRAMYTSSIQYIHNCFHHYLIKEDSIGIGIADSRNPSGNAHVSHSIFTQKFKVGGDSYSRVVEMPTFGHSENFAGIQIVDLICSAIIFPMAIYTYCTGYINNVHMRPGYNLIKDRFAPRIEPLLFRYADANGRWRGGLTVDDKLGQRPSGRLFH